MSRSDSGAPSGAPNSGADTGADKSVSELEADIARTREALSSDVDDLSQQLNPNRYKAQFQEQAQGKLQSAQDAVMASVQEVSDSMVERSKEASSDVVEMIRNHPVPVTLVGLGVALLAVGGGTGVRYDDDFSSAYGDEEYGQRGVGARGGHTAYSYGERYEGDNRAERFRRGGRDLELGGYGHGAYGAYDSGYDAATGVRNTGEGRASEASDQAKRQARRRGRGLANFIEEHPLVAGIVTVFAGAVIGLALPGTRKEDELLGEAKGNLAGEAKSAAQRAREVAQKTFKEAKETAQREFSREEGAEGDAQGLLQKGKEAVRNVADDAKETAQREADKQNLG